jgi:hypothetical protein
MTWGQTIIWHTKTLTKYEVSTSGYKSPVEATEVAIIKAMRHGWTYPKWWQFWRINDTKPENYWR